MHKATFKGTVLAESNDTVIIEGNHYFPPSSINKEYFTDSTTHTVCGWKGTASYYNVTVDEKTIKDAAWYYPTTSDEAKCIEGYVAFYTNKVSVET